MSLIKNLFEHWYNVMRVESEEEQSSEKHLTSHRLFCMA